ncbi:hypothetical protein D9M68_554490 [compost metagenome]
MAVHVVGVQGEETVGGQVHVRSQAVLDALAHHGALLARNGEHVVFFLGQDGLAEGDVELLHRPVGVAAVNVAKLQMIGAQFDRQALCFGFECGRDSLRFGGHAAVHGKGQPGERIAKKPALHMGQGQNTLDLAILLGKEEIRGMPEHITNDGLPPRSVEERGIGTLRNEGLPLGDLVVVGAVQALNLQGAAVRQRAPLSSDLTPGLSGKYRPCGPSGNP